MAVDAGSITLAYQSLKSAGDILKTLRQAEQSLETAEYKLRIADLAGALADAKIQLADVQEYVQSLEAAAKLREHLEFNRSENIYRDSEGAPFCPKCFDGNNQACRMSERPDRHSWRCLTCDKVVGKPGDSPRRQTRAITR